MGKTTPTDTDSGSTGLEAPVTEASLSFWRGLAVRLAFLVPLLAAFAKAFTNSYSTLSIFIFFLTGVFIVNPALFSGPLVIVIGAMAIATIIVSLNMEGRSLYEDLCNLIKPTQKLAKTIAEKQKGVPDALSTYITGYVSYPFVWVNEKLASYFPSTWQKFKKYTAPAIALFLFTLSSATKGLAMAPGIFNILGLASCGPWGWVVLAVAAVAVMGVSAAKEGKKLLKQAGAWHTPQRDKDKKITAVSTFKKWLVYLLSAILPLTAAAAKAFGYSYGVLMLLAFVYGGSFTAIGTVSAWLPLILVVGIALAIVSLRMEGYGLFKLVRRLFISDDELGMSTKYYLQRELERKENKHLEDIALEEKTQQIEAALAKYPYLKIFARVVSIAINDLAAYSLPMLAFAGKSSIMMVGTISAIVLLSGGMPITWWLLLIGAAAGLAVGLVSLQKEGKKTRNSVNKYYTLLVYKWFVKNDADLELPLFDSTDTISKRIEARAKEEKQSLTSGQPLYSSELTPTEGSPSQPTVNYQDSSSIQPSFFPPS